MRVMEGLRLSAFLFVAGPCSHFLPKMDSPDALRQGSPNYGPRCHFVNNEKLIDLLKIC